jgi:lipopolysaccharide biosynthesis glycosyltransferase
MSLPVNVVTAADESYRPQAEVLIRSLALTQQESTHLTVLGSGWTSNQVSRLARAGLGRVDVEVVALTDPRAAQIPTLRHGFPPAATYSVLAAELAKFDGEHRIVYLDADTLVRHPLREIAMRDMASPVAAVVDAHVALVGMPSMWRPWREEGVDPMAPYLNTGVMVIDVEHWRAEGLTDRVFGLLSKYQLPCVDQDALNLVLAGGFDRLDPRWNLMPYHLMTLLRTSDLVEEDNRLDEAISDPAIIHYHRSFLGKPWQIGCSHPGRDLWRNLASDLGCYRRSMSFRDLVRNFGARAVGMSSLDERALSLATMSWPDNLAG